MGVYLTAYFLYAIPLGEEKHVTKKSITRYNQTSGEPYQKDVSETTHVTVVKDTSISVEDDGYINDELRGNDMFHGYNGPRFIGIQLGQADPNDDEAVEVGAINMETLQFDLRLMLSKYFDPERVEKMMEHAGLFLYGQAV